MRDDIQEKKELLEIAKMRDKLLMAISHEIRTPLNAIFGSAELLALSSTLGEKEQNYLSNIRESARTLQKIANNITDYLEVKQDELNLQIEDFSISDVLDEIHSTIYLKAREKNIQFIVHIDPQIPKKMKGDVRKLQKVLTHLLNNGIKYTEKGFIKLDITQEKTGEQVVLCYKVSDTGIGIKSKNQDSIMDVFTKLEMDTFIESVGLGLGLTICREYIRAMGGEIKCTSEYEKGSEFSFVLENTVVDPEPIAKVKDVEAIKLLIITDLPWRKELLKDICEEIGIQNFIVDYENLKVEEEFFTHIFIDDEVKDHKKWLEKKLPYACEKVLVVSGERTFFDDMKRVNKVLYEPFTVIPFVNVLNQWNKKKTNVSEERKKAVFKTRNVRALVVDDNEVNLMIAANILKQYNMEVDEADSGTMAVTMYYNNVYDLVLMDYLMPDMNGVEATKNMRSLDEERKPALIIALSANITEEIKKLFFDAGAQSVMEKPIEIKKLSKELKKWLPEEKLANTQEDKGNPRELEAVRKESLGIALGDVEELEWKEALQAMCSTVENYVKVLKISCSNITEQVKCIQGAENLVQVSDIRIYFHSLKGVFVNIGAYGLGEAARFFEAAAEKEDEAYMTKHKDAYLMKVQMFVSQIREALTLYGDILASTTSAPEMKIMDAKEFSEKLERIKRDVSRFEFNEVTPLVEELIMSSQGKNKEYLERAAEYLQVFEYEKALEQLMKI